MKIRQLFPAIASIVVLLACNLPAVAPQQPQPGDASTPADPLATHTPGFTPTITDTPLPSDTPTITPTATPSIAMVTPKDEAVNCRFGPGVNYVASGALLVGNNVPILGKTEDGTWWQIQNPNAVSQKCWVSAGFTTATGDLGTVAVVSAPLAFVTGVTISVTPKVISVAGCMGPIQAITLKGTITVNGPTTVKWHFATQQGGSLSTHTTVFTGFGSQEVSDGSYTPALTEGDYWARLIVDSPNNVSGEATYEIECP